MCFYGEGDYKLFLYTDYSWCSNSGGISWREEEDGPLGGVIALCWGGGGLWHGAKYNYIKLPLYIGPCLWQLWNSNVYYAKLHSNSDWLTDTKNGHCTVNIRVKYFSGIETKLLVHRMWSSKKKSCGIVCSWEKVLQLLYSDKFAIYHYSPFISKLK